MSTEFFVIMQKRSDGKAYADLHKASPTIYLDYRDAEAALAVDPLKAHRHIVRLVAMTVPSFNALMSICNHAKQGGAAVEDWEKIP